MTRVGAALLLTCLLATPLALADQNLSAGPASARTLNAQGGDGCAEGGNGSTQRYAEVKVALTQHESVVVLFSQSCSAWNQTWDGGYSRGTAESGVVMAGRSSDNNPGPVAQAGYADMRDDSSWGSTHMCGSYAYVSGPGVTLGCYPDGGHWPMAPELP